MADDGIAPLPAMVDSIDDTEPTFYHATSDDISSHDLADKGAHSELAIQSVASNRITSHGLARNVDPRDLVTHKSSLDATPARLTTRLREARQSLEKSGDYSEHQINTILDGLKQSAPLHKPSNKPSSSVSNAARLTSKLNEAREILERSGAYSEYQTMIILEGLKQSISPPVFSATRPATAGFTSNCNTTNKPSLPDNKGTRRTSRLSEVRESLERSGTYDQQQVQVILQRAKRSSPLNVPAAQPKLAKPSLNVNATKKPGLGRSILTRTPRSKSPSPLGVPRFARPPRDDNASSPTPLSKAFIPLDAPGSHKPRQSNGISSPTPLQSTFSPPGAPRKRPRDESSYQPFGVVSKKIRILTQPVEKTPLAVASFQQPVESPLVQINSSQTTIREVSPATTNSSQSIDPEEEEDPSNPRPNTGSLLLSLPGELRNRIYRYTLLCEKVIEVKRQNYASHQPGLLQTNRQIRAEALPIFYLENKINTAIHDWDPVVKERMHHLWASHNLPKSPHLSHYFSGGPDWANLLTWLKAFYDDRCGKISECVGKKDRTLERKTVGAMFLVVRKAKGTAGFWECREAGWERVLEVLMAHRGLLGMGDARWLN